MKLYDQYIALYAADVRANPGAFKLSVSANPEAAAADLIEGMDDSEVRQMLAYLKAEIKAVKKGAA